MLTVVVGVVVFAMESEPTKQGTSNMNIPGIIFFTLFLVTIIAWAFDRRWFFKRNPSVCIVYLASNQGTLSGRGFTPFFGLVEEAEAEARKFLTERDWRANTSTGEFVHTNSSLKAIIVVSEWAISDEMRKWQEGRMVPASV